MILSRQLSLKRRSSYSNESANRSSGRLQDFKDKLIIGGILLGVAVGGGYFIVRALKKRKSNLAEDKSMDDGAPAMYASRLKMAFDNDLPWGMGTDEDEVRAVFKEIPTQSFYDKVQAAYKALYQSNLNRDLKDELDTADYNEMIRIKNGKPAK